MKKLAEIAAAAAMAAGLAPTMASAAVVLDAQGHAAVEGAVVKARGGEPGAAWTLIDWRGRQTGVVGVFGEDGTFAAVSPCAEALALERGDLSGDALAVSGANRDCVVAAVSRDGAPLPRSADVLVVHVTNMSATGLRWEDGSTVSSWGGFPLLVERGTARVSLAADGPRRVEALDADGNPVGIVPAAFENGRISFLADVSAFPCGVVAYRLRR